jgi:deoxyribodipyrimidine photo-lyase
MTSYKASRNGLLGLDFSTKLSAWLALGCITARQIHHTLLDFEDAQTELGAEAEGYGNGENEGTKAVRYELLWRDYMRLCTRKFGNQLFRLDGFQAGTSFLWKNPSQNHDVKRTLDRFLEGTTGMGLIDASQRELYLTGYTSNCARQNVASFLTKHLQLDWRIGAEWYESMLVDYDVSSNWGNWQYVAGVGNDPRGEARVFNPVKQAFDYDPQAEYIKAWVEELRGVQNPADAFQAWTIPEERRAELGLQGLESVEWPLKRINFVIGSGRHGGGKPRNGDKIPFRGRKGPGGDGQRSGRPDQGERGQRGRGGDRRVDSRGRGSLQSNCRRGRGVRGGTC